VDVLSGRRGLSIIEELALLRSIHASSLRYPGRPGGKAVMWVPIPDDDDAAVALIDKVWEARGIRESEGTG
jgi:hypothetical protein